MSERGFIALARGVLDHPIVGVRPRTAYSQAEAWQWLLFEAAWKDRTYRAGSVVVELQRGQLAHSTRYMAKAWRWPETSVRRFLKRLETGAGTGAMIGAESGAGVTVITICNYERYQSTPDEVGAESGAPDGAEIGAKVAHERRRKEQGNKGTIDNARAKARGEPEGFADWYGVYPRKAARLGAAKAFATYLKRADLPLADLMTRTRAFADGWAKRPEHDRKFIPYPASWLNDGSYLEAPAGGGAKGAAPARRPEQFTETEWRNAVQMHRSGQWSNLFGPKPGQAGCLVPQHLLEGVPS